MFDFDERIEYFVTLAATCACACVLVQVKEVLMEVCSQLRLPYPVSYYRERNKERTLQSMTREKV